MRSINGCKRNILTIMVLFVALMGTVVTPGTTNASRSGCRGDPVMLLTDGTAIDISTDIGTEVWNVDSIVYTVHAPVGSRVLTTVYTNGILGIHETMVFRADAPSNRYTVDVVVYTQGRGITASATTTVIKLLRTDMKTASGTDRQHLTMQLNP